MKWHDVTLAVLRAVVLVVATLAADVQVRGALTELVRVLLGEAGLPAPPPVAVEPKPSALKSCNRAPMILPVLRSQSA